MHSEVYSEARRTLAEDACERPEMAVVVDVDVVLVGADNELQYAFSEPCICGDVGLVQPRVEFDPAAAA